MIPDTNNDNTEEPIAKVVAGPLRAVRNYVLTKAAKGVPLFHRIADRVVQKRKPDEGGLKSHKIVLPKVQTHSYIKTLVKAQLPWRNVVTSRQQEASASPQEIDAFRMKAISVLLKHAGTSVSEAMRCVRTSPIKAIMVQGENETAGVVALQQRLMTFPGEFVEVQGSFRRRVLQTGRSTPIPESFSAETLSTQTGFPHPSQHTGWALSEALLVEYPQRPHLLPHLTTLLERKRDAGLRLLPHGSLIGKAKQSYGIRRRVFDENRKIFLPRLQSTMEILCPSADRETIKAFFAWLQERPSAFSDAAATHHKIRDLFIERPAKCVLDAFDGQREGTSISDIFAQGLFASREVLSAECAQEEAVSEYTVCLGESLAPMALEICQQVHSDRKGYPALPLSGPAKTLQTLAYKQVLDFLNELEDPSETTSVKVRQRLESLLDSDRNVLLGNDAGLAGVIASELEVYYR